MTEQVEREGMPRWVKIFGLVLLLVVVLVLVMFVFDGGGGQHGPQQHSSGEVPRIIATGAAAVEFSAGSAPPPQATTR